MNRKITSAIIIIAIIVAIMTIVFADRIIPKDLYGQYGILVVIIPLVILIIIIIIIGSTPNKKKRESPKNIEKKRKELVEELKVAEKKFLKHKIDKQTFDKISMDKNSELISIESEIDANKKPTLNKEDNKKFEGISRDKQKVLKELLEQKQKKVYELKTTEKSYLKRKIDEKIFKQLSSKINEEIISIDGKINAIQKAEKIKQLQNELKLGAKEVAKQKDSSDKRKKQLTEIEMLEEDLLSQLK